MRIDSVNKSLFKADTLAKAFNNRFNSVRLRNSSQIVYSKYEFNYIAA